MRFSVDYSTEDLESIEAWSRSVSSAGKRERDEAMTRDHDPIITNAVGMMGELAVARLLGVSVDTSVHAGGDGGVDMVYRKKTVCVKTVSSP